MFCKSCGNEIKAGAKFCENCGAKVEEVVAEEVVAEETVFDEVVVEDTVSSNESAKADDVEKVEGQVVNDNGRSYSNAGTSSKAKATAKSVEDKGFAIASLVCGIVSLLCCCCTPLGVVCGGVAIGLGIYVIKKELPGREMAIAGIACGGVAVFFCLISGVLKLVGLAIPGASNFDVDNFIDSLDL